MFALWITINLWLKLLVMDWGRGLGAKPFYFLLAGINHLHLNSTTPSSLPCIDVPLCRAHDRTGEVKKSDRDVFVATPSWGVSCIPVISWDSGSEVVFWWDTLLNASAWFSVQVGGTELKRRRKHELSPKQRWCSCVQCHGMVSLLQGQWLAFTWHHAKKNTGMSGVIRAGYILFGLVTCAQQPVKSRYTLCPSMRLEEYRHYLWLGEFPEGAYAYRVVSQWPVTQHHLI